VIELNDVIGKLLPQLEAGRLISGADIPSDSMVVKLIRCGWKVPYGSAKELSDISGVKHKDILLAMIRAYHPKLITQLVQCGVISEDEQ
jgi:hypothetical protein